MSRSPRRSLDELIASSGYDPNDPLLTATQAAAVLCVSPETIRRWMRKGALRFEMIGPEKRLRRIRRSALSDVHVDSSDRSTNTNNAQSAHGATSGL